MARKRTLQNVYRARRRSDVRRPHRGFVDDYDLHVAHYLGAGLRRVAEQPAQAARSVSGTSGMKASANGVPQRQHRRRLVGRRLHGRERLADRSRRDAPDDHGAQDAADAEALYRLLEEQIVPASTSAASSAMPRRWIGMIKDAIRTVAPPVRTRRMVSEYVQRMYEPGDASGRARSSLERAEDETGCPVFLLRLRFFLHQRLARLARAGPSSCSGMTLGNCGIQRLRAVSRTMRATASRVNHLLVGGHDVPRRALGAAWPTASARRPRGSRSTAGAC